MRIRTYTELIRLPTFEERYDYLRLAAKVGEGTFGADRYLNQALYASPEWKHIRIKVIARDMGCDLGVEGYEIEYGITIHHMNPITIEDIETGNPDIFNPEFLICTSSATHRAIHYGDKQLLPKLPTVRAPFDTCPWKGGSDGAKYLEYDKTDVGNRAGLQRVRY